jgi:hypothetical protein
LVERQTEQIGNVARPRILFRNVGGDALRCYHPDRRAGRCRTAKRDLDIRVRVCTDDLKRLPDQLRQIGGEGSRRRVGGGDDDFGLQLFGGFRPTPS